MTQWTGQGALSHLEPTLKSDPKTPNPINMLVCIPNYDVPG